MLHNLFLPFTSYLKYISRERYYKNEKIPANIFNMSNVSLFLYIYAVNL